MTPENEHKPVLRLQQEGVEPTPKELWNALMRCKPEVRMEHMAMLIQGNREASDCFVQAHRQRINDMGETIIQMRQQMDAKDRLIREQEIELRGLKSLGIKMPDMKDLINATGRTFTDPSAGTHNGPPAVDIPGKVFFGEKKPLSLWERLTATTNDGKPKVTVTEMEQAILADQERNRRIAMREKFYREGR